MLRTGIIALAAAYIVIAPAHAEQDAIKSADPYARCRSEVLKDRWRADVNLSGNLYKLCNPGGVLPIVPKEL